MGKFPRIVPDELWGANLTQDAARIAYTPTCGLWLLHAPKSAAAARSWASGATISGVNIHDDRETEKIDALDTKVREAIHRFKELCTALISAAVTGKVVVRNEAHHKGARRPVI